MHRRYFSEIESYDPISTTITGATLTSFEPFTLAGGRTYGAYQLYEGGGIPGDSTGEIWLKGIGSQASVHLRVSEFQGDVAVDPEYVIGTDSVWIFYYGKPVGSGFYNLHRCSTPLSLDAVTALEPREETKPAITLYPNPAPDYIVMQAADNRNYTYQITCSNGQHLASGAFRTQKSIGVVGFPPGLYCINIVGEDGSTSSLKFIR